MRLVVQFDPGISLWFSVVLLSLSWAPAAASTRCQLDECGKNFNEYRRQLNWDESASAPYCSAIQLFLDCLRRLRRLERACHSDLAYHASEKILTRKMSRLDCSTLMLEAAATAEPPSPDESSSSAAEVAVTTEPARSKVCAFHGDASDVVFCGLFGDPHVRTFWGDYQTCRTRGAWPLMDNVYLAVQVTNEPTGDNLKATAPSKITVVVKGSAPCTTQLTYEAQSDHLPDSFVDGSRWSHAAGERSVFIEVLEPDRHVRIHLRHINATLVVRRAGSHLTFAARLPRQVAQQSVARSTARQGLDLCARGCPRAERIDYRYVLKNGNGAVEPVGDAAAASGVVLASLSGRTVTRDNIVRMCGELGVTDFYLDACVFDVLFSGRASFMESARLAQRDLRELLPSAARQLASRTQLDLRQTPAEPAPTAAAAGFSCPVTIPLSLLVIAWIRR